MFVMALKVGGYKLL